MPHSAIKNIQFLHSSGLLLSEVMMTSLSLSQTLVLCLVYLPKDFLFLFSIYMNVCTPLHFTLLLYAHHHRLLPRRARKRRNFLLMNDSIYLLTKSFFVKEIICHVLFIQTECEPELKQNARQIFTGYHHQHHQTQIFNWIWLQFYGPF